MTEIKTELVFMEHENSHGETNPCVILNGILLELRLEQKVRSISDEPFPDDGDYKVCNRSQDKICMTDSGALYTRTYYLCKAT